MTKPTCFKVSPLGGVGEIGSNMTVFETDNHMIVFDYGILFPYDDFFDIRYLIVDTADLKTDKEITLFITHGHEDHIGAIHHFIDEYPETKIVAPEFAYQLIKYKLESRKLPCKVQVYNESDIFTFDNFQLHPLHVTHSIPDTYGAIWIDNEKDLSVLFISDFKHDYKPIFEDAFNIEKVKNIFGSAKQRIAFLDSTNILKEGNTLSESDLTESLEQIIKNKKRTFLTMFSSNIYRMKNILELAKKNNRKITTIGRSIGNYLAAANEAGLIKLEDYKIIDFDSVQNYSDPNLLLLVTGSQGEFLGASTRISNGDQKNINLTKDDVFVFSSRPIPGNEKKINRLLNKLTDFGVEIITARDAQIHASGHPAQDDLYQLIEKAKPTDYVPIHGETYFLTKHEQFINKNFPNIKVHLLKNFQGLDFKDGRINYFDLTPRDPLLIHGNDLVIEKEKISERRKIACNGVVFISLGQKDQKVLITTKGLPVMADDQLLKLNDHINYLAFSEFKNRDYDYTVEQVRIKVRNFYQALLGYKPITIVQML